MENLLKYTNGGGHLLMSVVMSIIGLCLVLFSNDAATKAIGITLILTVQGAWFIPGAAKQVAYEVSKQMTTPLASITPPASSPVPASVPVTATAQVTVLPPPVAGVAPENEDTQPRPIVKV